MANQIADASTPNTVNFTVARRYLTEREVERLIEAAKSNRHGHPSAHASSRLRLQARQRRPRYSRSAALSRSQEYPAHSTLYRAKSRQIQRFLARLAKPTNYERQKGNTWGSYSMVSV